MPLSFDYSDDPRTVAKLLTMRDMNGLPCIMKAITRQSLSCIRPLLEHVEKLDFNSFHMNKLDALQSDDKKNILHVAAQLVRDKEIINTMENSPVMKQLADGPDSTGTTPLIVACKHQNHLMAQSLVSRFKAKIDHVDNEGYSPIYWTVVSGSAETLKFFLAAHGECETLLYACRSLPCLLYKILDFKFHVKLC